ncbi:MAG: phosphoserine transaminase [Micavibrio aeruginosavorus]|uniref:phosphoserine transaminase n=1 Tax=Micavibrio aeruginosavorus TaxID=349221 RepID=A0A2W5N3W2_9BACT|nr:MAG: phosphoserine transaminase [Micavibrio aeruginosavorus]
MTKPTSKPKNPCFSSGPCAKRPGWSFENLSDAFLGRSHRAATGKAKLNEVCDRHRALLGIPADYKVAIVPASDTGAIEMAMWSMLGARPVDMIYWESFGLDWTKDVTDQLKLENVTVHKADYGFIPDLAKVNTKENDIVFTWNGTTSGVRAPDNHDWIAADRKGLTFCDATSAVFAYDMPWDKLDVTTWSWQKVLGGEGAHGMLVLSPRAVERLESFKAPRPLPKIFRMTKGGKFADGIFKGETINTPSMMAVEDCLDALKWVESIGGVKATIKRCEANIAAVAKWVDKSPIWEFLCDDNAVRSRTSITLKIIDPWFTAMGDEERQAFIKSMVKPLDKESVAYDIASYRDAPAGLRIWGGATVEAADLEILMPWIDWAYEATKSEEQKKAA